MQYSKQDIDAMRDRDTATIEAGSFDAATIVDDAGEFVGEIPEEQMLRDSKALESLNIDRLVEGLRGDRRVGKRERSLKMLMLQWIAKYRNKRRYLERPERIKQKPSWFEDALALFPENELSTEMKTSIRRYQQELDSYKKMQMAERGIEEATVEYGAPPDYDDVPNIGFDGEQDIQNFDIRAAQQSIRRSAQMEPKDDMAEIREIAPPADPSPYPSASSHPATVAPQQPQQPPRQAGVGNLATILYRGAGPRTQQHGGIQSIIYSGAPAARNSTPTRNPVDRKPAKKRKNGGKARKTAPVPAVPTIRVPGGIAIPRLGRPLTAMHRPRALAMPSIRSTPPLPTIPVAGNAGIATTKSAIDQVRRQSKMSMGSLNVSQSSVGLIGQAMGDIRTGFRETAMITTSLGKPHRPNQGLGNPASFRMQPGELAPPDIQPMEFDFRIGRKKRTRSKPADPTDYDDLAYFEEE
ncbi:MAG: hypothetical protein PHR28_13095 [candidate division Zixibacteria bacterium]|nr:hypothetical protein [candidate division Zixibacteria bacterium]